MKKIEATPLTETQQSLVESNTALVGWAVKRLTPAGWHRGILDNDDLASAGMLGLIRAAQTHDPAKGAFTTHASYHIRCQILTEMKNRQDHIRIPLSVDPAERSRLAEALMTVPISGDTQIAAPEWGESHRMDDTRDEVERILARLPRRQADILRERMAGKTLSEIGKALGVTRERVRQIEAMAYEYVRRKCG